MALNVAPPVSRLDISPAEAMRPANHLPRPLRMCFIIEEGCNP
jgi:hypothetical protein